MTFKSWIWRPVAIGASVLNLVAVGFAAGSAEPWHAAAHAALALAFGTWAERLRRSPARIEPQDRMEVLEEEINVLRQELSEAQERLDFTERLLAQRQEPRRVGPEN
jgi:hypothetical protein